MNKKKIIMDFIRKNDLAVVSTVNADGLPESAVVAYSETDKMEIIFGSFCTSRKNTNIKRNPCVAIVIGWNRDDMITVQYEGEAIEIPAGDSGRFKKMHLAKIPDSARYLDHPDERLFLVRPRWIRYSDLKKVPEEIFEVTFIVKQVNNPDIL
ncbi:MAG: pyridoxamine 5'-phosphate oxidase family protein [Candidatus Aenigmarchaeota archaeon]|nr:pyridoxamine 5'-phosphate oxidase family protein [Candidatus Aenigmarchaeota archaeon]